MYLANALNRFLFDATIHGIPISSVAPWGDISTGNGSFKGVVPLLVGVCLLVIVSADPFLFTVRAPPITVDVLAVDLPLLLLLSDLSVSVLVFPLSVLGAAGARGCLPFTTLLVVFDGTGGGGRGGEDDEAFSGVFFTAAFFVAAVLVVEVVDLIEVILGLFFTFPGLRSFLLSSTTSGAEGEGGGGGCDRFRGAALTETDTLDVTDASDVLLDLGPEAVVLVAVETGLVVVIVGPFVDLPTVAVLLTLKFDATLVLSAAVLNAELASLAFETRLEFAAEELGVLPALDTDRDVDIDGDVFDVVDGVGVLAVFRMVDA